MRLAEVAAAVPAGHPQRAVRTALAQLARLELAHVSGHGAGARWRLTPAGWNLAQQR